MRLVHAVDRSLFWCNPQLDQTLEAAIIVPNVVQCAIPGFSLATGRLVFQAERRKGFPYSDPSRGGNTKIVSEGFIRPVSSCNKKPKLSEGRHMLCHIFTPILSCSTKHRLTQKPDLSGHVRGRPALTRRAAFPTRTGKFPHMFAACSGESITVPIKLVGKTIYIYYIQPFVYYASRHLWCTAAPMAIKTDLVRRQLFITTVTPFLTGFPSTPAAADCRRL